MTFSGPVNIDSFVFERSSGLPQQPWQPPGGSGNLSVSVSENTWGGGATVNVTVKNDGSTAVNGWEVNLGFSGDVRVNQQLEWQFQHKWL